MLHFTFKNTRYDLHRHRSQMSEFKRTLKLNGIDVFDFLKSEYGYTKTKCKYCDNIVSPFKLLKDKFIILDDGFFKLNLNVLTVCREKPCESFYVNPQSKRFFTEFLGMTVDECNSILSAKTKKGCDVRRENGFYDDISNNPFSKEYWIKKGLSPDEALLKVKTKAKLATETKVKRGFYDDISNNPFSKEYWIKKGLSPDEALLKVKTRNWACKEFSKYFVPEHIRGKTNSIIFGTQFLGLSEYDATMRYHRIGNNISKGFNYTKIGYNSNKNMASVEATKLFLKIYKVIRKKYKLNPNEIFFAGNKYSKGEYFIHNKNRPIVFYDFTIPKYNICIEYHGTHVHPNPNMSDHLKVNWKHAFNKNDYHTQRNIDTTKNNIIIERGFKLKEIWSSEQNKIETILNFIENQINEKNTSEPIESTNSAL